MRVAHTHSGDDIWIEYYLKRIGLHAYNTFGYLYTNTESTGLRHRVSERDVNHDTLVAELDPRFVDKRNWRSQAYFLWKQQFGDATWRDDDLAGC